MVNPRALSLERRWQLGTQEGLGWALTGEDDSHRSYVLSNCSRQRRLVSRVFSPDNADIALKLCTTRLRKLPRSEVNCHAGIVLAPSSKLEMQNNKT